MGLPFDFLSRIYESQLKTWFFSSIRRMYQYSKKGSSSTKQLFLGIEINCSSRYHDWEYESEVWLALSRMLLSFSESGYLKETIPRIPDEQGETMLLLCCHLE